MKIIPLLLALGLGVGGFVVPTAAAAPQDGGVTIVAAPAFAGVVRPGQTLLVSGLVTNDTDTTLDVGTASVRISASEITTRSALARWLSGGTSAKDALTGSPLGEAKIGVLDSGQSRSFSLTVPATALAFATGKAGVYPLEIGLAADHEALATQRSAVSLFAVGKVPRVNLALTTPVNAPPSARGLLDFETLAVLTAPGGLLDNRLNTAIEHSVTIGVDPMIVASIRVLGESAPPSAREWLQRLGEVPNDVFTLSYADSDQLLLHEAGATEPLVPLSFPEHESVAPEPQVTASTDGSATVPAIDAPPAADSPLAIRTTINGLAWPARALSSADDLDYLASGGTTRTLLSSSEVSGSSLSTPNVTVGKHQVTVYDDQVSALLRSAASAVTEREWERAVAILTATLAVTATQSPDATVVATFNRESAPSTQRVSGTLSAIESLSWVTPIPLSSALAIAPVKGSISESSAGTTSGSDAVLDRTLLTKELVTSEQSLSQFSSVADDPTLITGPQRLNLLALASATWEGNFSGWVNVLRGHLSENGDLFSSVYVPGSSSITFLQETGNLPIAVRNELDFPVTVYVTVRPERAILTVKDYQVKITVEADSQAKASIPVESIANGEVRTTVSLSSSTGVPISTPTTVVLNVQAGWETTATVVLAVIVILLFAAGIWRTVLRRRTLRAARESTDQEA